MDKSILDVIYESARELYEAGVMDRAMLEQFLMRHDIDTRRVDYITTTLGTTIRR